MIKIIHCESYLLYLQHCFNKYYLYKKKNIKRLIAAFLFAVFALAVSPKVFVHKLFASHSDAVSKSCNAKSPQINNAGFNCQCDHQVAESNFVGNFISPIFISFQAHLFINPPEISFVSVSPLFINLRGPPAKILRS